MKNKIYYQWLNFLSTKWKKTWEVTLDNYHHVKKVTTKLENYLNN